MQQDVLSKEYIKKQLKEAGIHMKLQVMEEVTSTNTLLRQYAEEGECEDKLLIAEYQTEGRGRKGRHFFSPKGTGLYMSLLLHPRVPAGEVHMLTTLAAAATAKALEAVSGKEAKIKWVNDIFIDGKKTVGILTEASGTLTEGSFDYVVVGIGINVYEPAEGFAEEIRNLAGAVFGNSVFFDGEFKKVTKPREDGLEINDDNSKETEKSRIPAQGMRDNLRGKIAAEVVKQFMKFYKVFPEKIYLEEYRSRSFLIGKEVKIIPTEQMMENIRGTEHMSGQDTRQVKEERNGNAEGARACADTDDRCATVLGIDEQCRLRVRYKDGREEFLSSGEVSVRER